jgi:hypothetical protein
MIRKLLQVARTGAGLAAEKYSGVAHAAEALQLRRLDRGITCC